MISLFLLSSLLTLPDGLSLFFTQQSYNLTVSAPTVVVHANTVFGAMYALESFSQLVDRGTFVNGTTIVDHPRYQFRATMIDTSRHYYPVEVILQHIDAMSYSKFNVLHWHIVDSISFPYQSIKFPEMSKQGAYSPDHVYTADDIRQIVSYAMNRGIRVIPEFDTPGHVREGYAALDPPILTTCYDSNGKPIEGVGGTGPLDVVSQISEEEQADGMKKHIYTRLKHIKTIKNIFFFFNSFSLFSNYVQLFTLYRH